MQIGHVAPTGLFSLSDLYYKHAAPNGAWPAPVQAIRLIMASSRRLLQFLIRLVGSLIPLIFASI